MTFACGWLGHGVVIWKEAQSAPKRVQCQASSADPACALEVVDTRTAQLVLAGQTATGSSGDYLNEIHPTRGGYNKLADVWRQVLDALP